MSVTLQHFVILQPHAPKYEAKQKRKFSSFFKSLVIELDKDLYGPDNHLVEVLINSLYHLPSTTSFFPHLLPFHLSFPCCHSSLQQYRISK